MGQGEVKNPKPALDPISFNIKTCISLIPAKKTAVIELGRGEPVLYIIR